MTKKLKNNPTHTFTTYDLGVSTALLCVGYKLLTIEKDDPKKALFVFDKEVGIESDANKYFSDRLEVKARAFFDQLKALKNRLYNQ